MKKWTDKLIHIVKNENIDNFDFLVSDLIRLIGYNDSAVRQKTVTESAVILGTTEQNIADWIKRNTVPYRSREDVLEILHKKGFTRITREIIKRACGGLKEKERIRQQRNSLQHD